MTQRARAYFQLTLVELALGYALGGLVVLAASFVHHMFPDGHGPVLDELFFIEPAFRQVLVSRFVLVHVSLYLAAKCLHLLLEGRGRIVLLIAFGAGALAAPALWTLPMARGYEVGGRYAIGFFLLGLPFLVLLCSHLSLVPKLLDRTAA